MASEDLFEPSAWFRPGQGSRYLQLSRHIEHAINDGSVEAGRQLPPEREIADAAQVSRVTVRNAISELVRLGLIEQRQGAGNFVTDTSNRTEQSLSRLVSFTENMKVRGRTSTSRVLRSGLYPPSPDEMMALGISLNQDVARINRLRSADGTPMAIELSSLPSDVLPNPEDVETSLYEVLGRHGQLPNRAIQRVSAVNISGDFAELLGVVENTAILQIDRTAFLESGRPIEFTKGYYRPDIYDFVTELRRDGSK